MSQISILTFSCNKPQISKLKHLWRWGQATARSDGGEGQAGAFPTACATNKILHKENPFSPRSEAVNKRSISPPKNDGRHLEIQFPSAGTWAHGGFWGQAPHTQLKFSLNCSCNCLWRKTAGAWNPEIEAGFWKQGEESSTALAKLPLSYESKKKNEQEHIFSSVLSPSTSDKKKYRCWI